MIQINYESVSSPEGKELVAKGMVHTKSGQSAGLMIWGIVGLDYDIFLTYTHIFKLSIKEAN